MSSKKPIKKIKKKCKFCQKRFNKEDFSYHGGLERAICVDCYSRERSDKKSKVREHLNEVKKDSACSKCGFDNPIALQFHHENPESKKRAIATMASQGYPLETIEKEIKKCTILCANCHAIKHQNDKK